MKQYNLCGLIKETESSLVSYLASSLPIGNHANQRRLGERFLRLWEEQTFRGPFIETVPRYKVLAPLSDVVQQGFTHSGRDTLFLRRIRPKYGWRDIDTRLGNFRRARQQLWPEGGNEAAEEHEKNSLRRLWELKLYAHQVQSINKLVAEAKNLVVATGTGSGKTECFLIPVLYELLTESDQTRKRPGVRALLLYPMNALVEDQMARLRRLLFWINLQAFDPSLQARPARPITFGRYIGETPVSAQGTGPDRTVSEEEIHELGELRYREEMQITPPDILVTNFTMLEYMLLRNDDKKLFQSSDLLKFLVLDEVHTYHGTRGMEVSTLLRRFRDFIGRGLGGKDPSYRCVGLSATLSTEEKATRKLARFASHLFGSGFEEDSIVLGEIASDLKEEAPPFNVSRTLEEILRLPRLTPKLCGAFAVAGSCSQAEEDEIPQGEWTDLALVLETEPPSSDFLGANPERTEILGAIVSRSPVYRQLRYWLAKSQGGVASADELAGCIFGSRLFESRPEDCREALGIVLQLALGGCAGGDALVSLRVHHFVKEHRQAQLCINPSHRNERTDGWWAELFVIHRERCGTCHSLAYPVFLCRKCGFVFLEGWVRPADPRLTPKHVYPEKDDLLGPGQFRRVLLRPQCAVTDVLREALIADQEVKVVTLCVHCGLRFPHDANNEQYRKEAIRTHPEQCPSASFVEAIEWSHQDQDAKITECPYCEQEWFKEQEVITPPALSLYAASTVLLEEIKRALDEPLKNTGRIHKALGFSDGRQQAALIASRLQRTNEDFTFRQLLYSSLVKMDGNTPFPTKSVVTDLSQRVEENAALQQLFCERDELGDPTAIRRRAATMLFRDTCTEFRTLESLGVSSIEYPGPLLSRGADYFASHPFTRRMPLPERLALATLVLDLGFRFRRWAMNPGNYLLDYTELQRYGYQDRAICKLGGPANTAGLSLKQANRRNRLLNLYGRLCQRQKVVSDLNQFKRLIEGFWDSVISCPELNFRPRTGAPWNDQKCFVVDGNDPDSMRVKLNWLYLHWRLQSADSPIYRCDTCGSLTRNSVLAVCPVRDCVGNLKESTLEELEHEQFSPARHYLHLLKNKPPKPLWVEEHTAQISPRARREIEKSFRDDSVGSIDVISGSTTFELGIDLRTINAIFLANMPPEVSNYRQRAGRAGRGAGMLPLVLTYVREKPHDLFFWNRVREFISGPLRVPRFAPPSHEVLLRHINAILFAHLVQGYPRPGGLEGPASGDFTRFCLDRSRKASVLREASDERSELNTSIKKILAANPTLEITPESCVKHFHERLEHVLVAYIPSREHDGTIPTFSDYGVLPSYNYPIYVDELRLYEIPRTEWPRNALKLQRDRSIALTEYYPGRIIVAGKVAIKSVGLWHGFVTQPMVYCRRCAFIGTQASAAGPTTCPNGCGMLVSRMAVMPLGGFAGKFEHGLIRQDPEVFLVRRSQYLFDPRGNPPPPYESHGRAIRAARQSSFHIHRSGARMRMFSPRPDFDKGVTLKRALLRDVAAPGRQPVECLVLPELGSGAAENVYLMHEFTTDILRLQIEDSKVGRLLLVSEPLRYALQSDDQAEKEKAETVFLWTLGQALCTGGARLLQIDPNELAFTFRRTPGNLLLGREIIVFDTASGGAGYCDQLYENLKGLFNEAAQVLDCKESCGDSCYSCLRSYENQVAHARLNRSYVLEGLRAFDAENWK